LQLSRKILGRDRSDPEELRLAAIKMFEPIDAVIDELASTSPSEQPTPFDEDALAKALVSGDLAISGRRNVVLRPCIKTGPSSSGHRTELLNFKQIRLIVHTGWLAPEGGRDKFA
jgi:hypothetical protein